LNTEILFYYKMFLLKKFSNKSWKSDRNRLFNLSTAPAKTSFNFWLMENKTTHGKFYFVWLTLLFEIANKQKLIKRSSFIFTKIYLFQIMRQKILL
jgi:hypothetical protein